METEVIVLRTLFLHNIYAFSAIYFSISPTLTKSHKFWYSMLSSLFSSECFIIFSLDFLFDPWVFRRVLLSFQTFVSFLYFCHCVLCFERIAFWFRTIFVREHTLYNLYSFESIDNCCIPQNVTYLNNCSAWNSIYINVN